MKLLHTSDWHFGMTFQGRQIREDQEFFVNRICEIVEQEHVDAVLVAGDVFDRSIASTEALDLYDNAMKRLCVNCNVPVLMIAGNHDGAERISSCNELLSKSGLHIAGVYRGVCECVALEDVEIFLLPWISTEQVKAMHPDMAGEIHSLEDAYRMVCNKVRENWDPQKKHVMVSHAFITKAETSTSDRAAVVGLATQVGASVFDGFDYVALGHIHKPQDIGEHIRYCGTPMAYSFGAEEHQEKSVTVVNTDDWTRKVIPLGALHDRVTLRGTMKELLSGDYTERTKSAFVRAEATDVYITMETYSQLRDAFPNLIEAEGKRIGGDHERITLTMEDLREKENDPEEIFRQFCADGQMECTEEIMKLFRQAVAECEEEEQE